MTRGLKGHAIYMHTIKGPLIDIMIFGPAPLNNTNNIYCYVRVKAYATCIDDK